MDFVGQGIGGVVRRQLAFGLEEDGAFIVVLVDDMNGDAALLFPVVNHRFMDMMAKHTFTAIERQQGWMDVDDAVGKGGEDVLGHQPKETGKDDPVDLPLLEETEHTAIVVEIGPAEITGGNTEFLGPLSHISIALVIYDTIDGDLSVVCKILADSLSVSAVTRC